VEGGKKGMLGDKTGKDKQGSCSVVEDRTIKEKHALCVPKVNHPRWKPEQHSTKEKPRNRQAAVWVQPLSKSLKPAYSGRERPRDTRSNERSAEDREASSQR